MLRFYWYRRPRWGLPLISNIYYCDRKTGARVLRDVQLSLGWLCVWWSSDFDRAWNTLQRRSENARRAV